MKITIETMGSTGNSQNGRFCFLKSIEKSPFRTFWSDLYCYFGFIYQRVKCKTLNNSRKWLLRKPSLDGVYLKGWVSSNFAPCIATQFQISNFQSQITNFLFQISNHQNLIPIFAS